jgi:DNA-binding transcriptional LysR family regulator
MDAFKDLNNLYFFAKVVDCGSYTAAAEMLGMQTSKLSRRIGALERELGVRLLNRTTSKKHSLTEAGKTLHRHCLALIAETEAAKDAINQTLSSPRGLVRISCPTGLLQVGVADILARYLAAYPEVQVAVEATNRRVDVVDEGFDIAIRVRVPPLDESDLAMRSFGPSDMILVGSPALLAAYGQPEALTDIARIPTLTTGTLGREQTWHFVDGESRPIELVHNPRLSANDFYTVRRAALQGLGVARLPALLARDDLSSGALVRLLPSLVSRSGVVHAVFPSRRGIVPAVRSLLDALSEGFAANPWIVSAGSIDRACQVVSVEPPGVRPAMAALKPIAAPVKSSPAPFAPTKTRI